MIQNLKLYFYCSRLIIRGSMLHRFSFFAGIIGQWLGYGATYFSLYVMVSQLCMHLICCPILWLLLFFLNHVPDSL